MDLPDCYTANGELILQAGSIYPGDGITDHYQLIRFLEYQQSQIENLKAEIQKLKRPSSWAPPRGALYDAGAHLKPRSGKD